MSVICPACDARFREPPAHVAPSRPLQCGKCEHEWVRQTVAAPSMAPSLDDLTDGARETADDRVGENALVPSAHRPAGPGTGTPIYVDTEVAQTAKRSSRYFGAVAASIMAVAVMSGAVVARDTIVTAAPQTLAFYEAVGLAPHAGVSDGLTIANVTTTRTRKDGISQLIVRGEIANAAGSTVPVPALKLTMRGQADQKVYAWTAKAASDNLGAGEKSTFTAVARDYPASAVDVEVTFEPATN